MCIYSCSTCLCGVLAGAMILSPGTVQAADAAASNVCAFIAQDAHTTMVTGVSGRSADCDVSESTDGAQIVHCNWVFAYRSAASEEFFDQTAKEVSACPAVRVPDEIAAPVNHPDTHIVRHYLLEARSITVSLKDKATLGRTYVFVTVRH